MPKKGFAYKYPTFRDTNDQEGLLRIILDNFRSLSDYLNGWVVAKDQDLTVDIDTLDVETVNLGSGGLLHANGREFIHVYDATGGQAIGATAWTQIQFDTENGSSGSLFTFDNANDEIDVADGGVFLVIGHVEFQTNESGYLRVLVDGTDEVGRAAFNTATGEQIVALYTAAGAHSVQLDAYTNTTSDTVAAGSSAAIYLEIARLFNV